MVVVYYDLTNGSCRKTRHWFRERHIEIQERRVDYISKNDLLHALFLSEEGFFELLKRPSRCDERVKVLLEKVYSLSFNEALQFILEHVELLKTPLIFDDHSLVIGYNAEAIRVFISSAQRKIQIK